MWSNALKLLGGSISGTGVLNASSYSLESGSIGIALTGAAVPVNKSTNGTVVLSGANTYGGGTNILAGSMWIGSSTVVDGSDAIVSGPLGTGLVTMSANTGLGTSDGTGYNFNAHDSVQVKLLGNATLGNGSSGTLILAGDLDLNQAGRTLTVYNSVNVTGVIKDGGATAAAVTLNGNGTLTLTGASTYSGGTTISTSGSLVLAGVALQVRELDLVSLRPAASSATVPSPSARSPSRPARSTPSSPPASSPRARQAPPR